MATAKTNKKGFPNANSHRNKNMATDELTKICEKIYSNDLRKQLGQTAPETLHELFASRGFEVKLIDLFSMTLTATLDLPPTQRIAPERGLTVDELKALKAGGFGVSTSNKSALPIAAGIADYTSLIAKSISVSEAAKVLGVEESRIRQRLTDRTIYGFKSGREWRLPSFQFDKNGLVPGIRNVNQNLPIDLHPVEIMNWFKSPCADLPNSDPEGSDLSPLDWLRLGNSPKPLIDIAKHL